MYTNSKFTSLVEKYDREKSEFETKYQQQIVESLERYQHLVKQKEELKDQYQKVINS